jgi:hypothetical protein
VCGVVGVGVRGARTFQGLHYVLLWTPTIFRLIVLQLHRSFLISTNIYDNTATKKRSGRTEHFISEDEYSNEKRPQFTPMSMLQPICEMRIVETLPSVLNDKNIRSSFTSTFDVRIAYN